MAKYQGLNPQGRKALVEGLAQSVGVADANKIIQTGVDGKLDLSLLPTGVGPAVAVIEASEALAAGDFVNVWNDGGVAKVRKADSAVDRRASGFTKDAVLSGALCTVYFEGQNDDLVGLTAGQKLWLGASGAVQTTPPALPGNVIHQYLGKAISATAMDVEIDEEILL